MHLPFLAATLVAAAAASAFNGGVRNHPAEVVHYDGPRLTRSPPKNDYLRPCYFTNWAQYRQGRAKYLPEDYIPGLCTHILFAFGWMNEDYTVRAFDPADLPNDWAGDGMYKRVNALKKSDPVLKTLLSFGGWSFGTRLFQEMATTADRRKTFINSAITFVRTWGFDGVDIDWEYPSRPTDVQNYVSLIQDMRAAMEAEATQAGKPRLLITAAVAAGEATINAGYDVPKLADHFDFILLMSYDFFGAWATELGFNSPLYARENMLPNETHWNVDFAASHWADLGMPKEKIVVGLPTYGRGWTLTDVNKAQPGDTGTPAKITQYTQEAGVAAYFEICEMLATGAVRHWHPEQQVPWLVQGNQWWSYDDQESILNKLAWLKRNQYGGAFVWTLDFDDFNAKCSNSTGQRYPLISLIAKELGGIVIPKSLPSTLITAAPPPSITVSTTALPAATTVATTVPASVTTTVSPSTNLCAGLSDGFQPLASSCTKFLLCVKGTPYTMNCPSNNLHFSRSKLYCVNIKDSDCKLPTATTTTPSPTTRKVPIDKYQCTKDGFFPDVTNCEKFIRCVNGNGYPFDCPTGLTFHTDSLMCDHPDPTKCATTNKRN